jgi:hypothetical protein
MTTVYEKNTGGLIKTGQRSITAFPSGLVRVDQLYVGKTGEESSHRALLSYESPMPGQHDTPAIGGVYIFPEVQESKNGDGFTSYQCSGYGATTTEFREISRNQIIIGLTGLRVTTFDYIGTIVKLKISPLTIEDIQLDYSLLTPIAVELVGFPFASLSSITEINISASSPYTRTYLAKFNPNESGIEEVQFDLPDPTLIITAQRNFGVYTEYELIATRYRNIIMQNE